MSKYKQAKYKIKHPEKFIGDPNELIFKSSWEERAFQMCDNNPHIIRWGYEIIPIWYLKPLPTGNYRKTFYLPDLYVEYYDKDHNFVREIVEIKPLKQTRASRARKSTTKLQENYTYAVNTAKWEAAKCWCENNGIKFSIVTENSIFKRKS